MVFGLFASYGIGKRVFNFSQYLSTLIIIPVLFPSIILGVAFLSYFSRINLHGNNFSVILTHIILLIPSCFTMIYLRLNQIPKDLEDASLNLGADQYVTFFRVTLPWLVPGMVGGFILAFTISFDEFVISWFITGFSPPLPVAIYNYMSAHLDPSLNALGAIIFLISLLLIILCEFVILPFFIRESG
jgi:spermidine/putrescine transport system permease protein